MHVHTTNSSTYTSKITSLGKCTPITNSSTYTHYKDQKKLDQNQLPIPAHPIHIHGSLIVNHAHSDIHVYQFTYIPLTYTYAQVSS